VDFFYDICRKALSIHRQDKSIPGQSRRHGAKNIALIDALRALPNLRSYGIVSRRVQLSAGAFPAISRIPINVR